MYKIEHIGIAVKNLKDSVPLFEQLLQTPCYKTEVVESEHVSTAFFQTGDTKLELLESSNEESAIGKFIDKRGEGMHHIAFAVSSLDSEVKRLKALGMTFIGEPKNGADNKRIIFLHPKCTNGVLVELCEEREGR